MKANRECTYLATDIAGNIGVTFVWLRNFSKVLVAKVIVKNGQSNMQHIPEKEFI